MVRNSRAPVVNSSPPANTYTNCSLSPPLSTADIQQAIDAGGIIKFGPGVYELNQTIVVRKSNTIIQGSGPGTVFIFKPTLPQVHCVNDRAFTTPCDVIDTPRRQILSPIGIGDYTFTAAGDLSDLTSGDWLIIGEKDRNVGGLAVTVDWAQVAAVTGNVVQVRTPFRTAFPNVHAWVSDVSGLGFYRLPQVVEGVQFRNFSVIVPDCGEGTPAISVFAAKGTLIDGVIAQADNGQPLYSYLAKELTICNSYGDGSKSQNANEFGSTVDLTLKNNTFSAGSAAVALDLGTGFFDISNNYVPLSSNIGMYLLYGIHDGTISGNSISFVDCNSGNANGISVRGSQRVTIMNNYLAGGAGSGSVGLTIGPSYTPEVPIPSSQNTISPNSFGNRWSVNYDPSNIP